MYFLPAIIRFLSGSNCFDNAEKPFMDDLPMAAPEGHGSAF